jgi:hypothetical protein
MILLQCIYATVGAKCADCSLALVRTPLLAAWAALTLLRIASKSGTAPESLPNLKDNTLRWFQEGIFSVVFSIVPRIQ